MTHARGWGDMAGNKKEHTRDIGTRCSRDEAVGSEFLSVTWYTGKRNVARKRISPINCQSNLATQKIPLPCFYDLPPASSTHIYFRLNFRSASKKASPRLIARVGFLSRFFQPSATEFARCSFDNDRVKCKYHRVGNLTDLLPSENYVKHPVMRKRMAFCHFERERKYVAVRSPFTSRICLFNAVIKSGVRREEFGVILLRYLDVLVAGENPAQITEKPARNERQIEI